MTTDAYTFGDTGRASARLRRLAELYESETRELLQRGSVRAPRLALDLGCGPGWSTKLLQEVLNPERTIGLDASERYIAEARQNFGPGLEFHQHDVARTPFPTPAPEVMLCRFLLTHLSSLERVLAAWASAAARGALLFIHETESLETEHPTLRRYYELVGQLQHHYGQTLYVGGLLDGSFADSGWHVLESRRLSVEKPASRMAELHLANVRTWRHDDYARRAFSSDEIDSIEASLQRIAEGTEEGGVVINAARQIIAQRN